MEEDFTPFNPNEGPPGSVKSGFMLPSAEVFGNGSVTVIDAPTYAAAFGALMKDAGNDGFNWAEVYSKSGVAGAAPNLFSFGRMSLMPSEYNKGALQRPGIAFESIGKIARENLAPQLIIGMRIDDVMRYSQLSTHPWRPGWQIEPVVIKDKPQESTLKDIKKAESFLLNSSANPEDANARHRDAGGNFPGVPRLTDFQGFLSGITRDTLTYDGIAVWTDMDNADRVKCYAQVPASQIRLCGPEGYLGKKDIFAVGVDEKNEIVAEFTRDQLIYYRRNIRSAGDSNGYGWGEIEIGVRLIQGFQNALDMNVDTFNRSAIPNGILVMSGETVTQKQLDVMNRMWTNLKKGVTKSWVLPVIGMSGKDSKLELLNLNDIKGMEVYYQDFMNMIIGAFATVYRFPVRRLGYRISGKGKDTEPLPDASTALVDDDDPGLAPLLIHLENVINEYLIQPTWPHLRFRFNGKSPKEDARELEAKKLARTWAEERADVGLPPLEETVQGDAKLKKLAKILGLAPSDTAKSGIFQSLAVALLEPTPPAGGAGAKTPGARFPGKKDAAASESHGATAGVRRNSRAEKQSSGEKS